MCGARLALHALRAERARRDVSVEWTDALLGAPAADPLVEELRARHAARLATALEAACLALPRRQRAVVRLLFVDGASVDEVAAMYQVHRVTVWRWVQDARAALAAQTRTSLGELAPDAPATDSFVAWVEDQVELSLDSVLAPTATHPRAS
jgi:RNA polymerase sigma-70 factor (ECF subfamily)